jgi:TIR domain
MMRLRKVTGGACPMRVFISWSGELSKQLAGAIRDWLPTTLQYVKPYFTPADIEKGAKWDQEISKELEDASICIIVLTRESLNSKWIMFEAGAISKSPGKSRLCTVLFGLEPTDVEGPLNRFQATRFSKEEIHKLLKTINANAEKEEALSDGTLDLVFEKWWPDLENAVKEIMKAEGSSAKVPELRDERDLLQEVLGLTRVMAEQQNQIRERVGELSDIDKVGKVIGAMISAYKEPPTGEVAEAGKLFALMARLKKPPPTDKTHTPTVTTIVFDANKPNEQPDKSPGLPFEQKGNVDLTKQKDSQLKK